MFASSSSGGVPFTKIVINPNGLKDWLSKANSDTPVDHSAQVAQELAMLKEKMESFYKKHEHLSLPSSLAPHWIKLEACLKQDPAATIAMIGLPNAGKSTLINALLSQVLLPVEPMQSGEDLHSVSFCPIEIQRGPIPNNKLEVTIHLINQEQYTDRRAVLTRSIGERQSDEEELAPKDINKKIADATELCVQLDRTWQVVNAIQRSSVTFVVGPANFKTRLTNLCVRNQLEQVVGVPGMSSRPVDMRMGIDRICIRYAQFFPWLRFVDLPGVADTNPTRSQMADQYLPQSQHLLLLMQADARSSSSPGFKKALHDIAAELLTSDAGDRMRACTVILTQLDKLEPKTEQKKVGGNEELEELPEDDDGDSVMSTSAAAGPSQPAETKEVETSDMTDVSDASQLSFMDLITPRLQDVVQATKQMVQSMIQNVYVDSKTASAARLKIVLDDLDVESTSGQDFLKRKKQVLVQNASLAPKLTTEQTGIPNLHQRLQRFAIHQSSFRQLLCQTFNDHKQNQLFFSQVQPLQRSGPLAADASYQAFVQAATLFGKGLIACKDQCIGAIAQTGKQMLAASSGLSSVIFVKTFQSEATYMAWNTLETRLARPKLSHWLSQVLVQSIQLQSSVGQPLEPSDHLEAALQQFTDSMQRDFVTFAGSVPEGCVPFLRHANAAAMSAVRFDFEPTEVRDSFHSILKDEMRRFVAGEVVTGRFVAPTIRNGTGYKRRMINDGVVAWMQSAPFLTAVDTVIKSAVTRFQQDLEKRQEVLDRCISSFRQTVDAIDVQLKLAMNDATPVAQQPMPDKAVLDEFSALGEQLLGIGHLKEQDFDNWLKQWGDLMVELNRPDEPTSVPAAIQHMYRHGYLNLHHIVDRAFYYVPWTWPTALKLDRGWKDLFAIPHDPNISMEIVAMDHSIAPSDEASIDSSKDLVAQLAQKMQKLWKEKRDLSPEHRALELSKEVDKALGGVYARSIKGWHECEAKLVEIRKKNNSNIVTMNQILHMGLGVCRHRSLLFKFLADLTRSSELSHTSSADANFNVLETRLTRGRWTDAIHDPAFQQASGHVWNALYFRRAPQPYRLLDIMHNPDGFIDQDQNSGNYKRGVGTKVSGTLGLTSVPLNFPRLRFGAGKTAANATDLILTSDKPIAQGGSCHIFSGTLDKYKVALKYPITPSANMKLRLIKEANILYCLQHYGLVARLYGGVDVDESASSTGKIQTSLVLEFVEGKTLEEDWARVVTLSKTERLQIIHSIAEALAACESLGIVHADVSLSNVMITADNRVKLIDFGHAHHVTSKDTLAQGSGFGQLPYAAPEMRSTQMTVAIPRAVDVYSLGVVAYELYTGTRVEEDDTAIDLQDKLRNLYEAAPRKIIQQCVQSMPASRCSVTWVIQQLEELLVST